MILIANIGNRNLTYEVGGQPLDIPAVYQHEGRSFNFRQRTQTLLEHHTDFSTASPFGVSIFSEHFEPEVTAIHLIASDQAGSTKYPDGHPQDTVYAGRIARHVVQAQFPAVAAYLHEYQGDPTDEAGLYPAFRNIIRQIQEQHPNEEIAVVDAGGTPQMKTVVKDLLRYYQTAQPVRVLYTNQSGDTREVGTGWHDRYVLLRAARQFVARYDYAAASSILLHLEPAATPRLLTLLAVADHRQQVNHSAAETILKTAALADLPPVFAEYRARKPTTDALNVSADDVLPQHRFDIVELAALCQLYAHLNDYSMLVVLYYRLCEELGQKIARQNGHDLQEAWQRYEFAKNVWSEVAAHYPKMRSQAGKPDKPAYGLPVLLGFASRYCSDELLPVVKAMCHTIQIINGKNVGINTVRNQSFLAHRATGVTADQIETAVPGFLNENGVLQGIFEKIGLPTTSVYDQMNAELLRLFQQE